MELHQNFRPKVCIANHLLGGNWSKWKLAALSTSIYLKYFPIRPQRGEGV